MQPDGDSSDNNTLTRVEGTDDATGEEIFIETSETDGELTVTVSEDGTETSVDTGISIPTDEWSNVVTTVNNNGDVKVTVVHEDGIADHHRHRTRMRSSTTPACWRPIRTHASRTTSTIQKIRPLAPSASRTKTRLILRAAHSTAVTSPSTVTSRRQSATYQ